MSKEPAPGQVVSEDVRPCEPARALFFVLSDLIAFLGFASECTGSPERVRADGAAAAAVVNVRSSVATAPIARILILPTCTHSSLPAKFSESGWHSWRGRAMAMCHESL